MYGGTARLPHGHQTGNSRIWIFGRWVQHFAPEIGRNSAHVIVHRRQNRDRLLGHINTCKNLGRFRDPRQALCQRFGLQMAEVEEDMIPLRPNTAPLANLHGHAARDVIARRQIFIIRRIALHKSLILRIAEKAALSARAFGDQTTRAIDARGVKLHKFHILKRQSCARDHAAAVSGTGMGRRGTEISASIAACGQYNRFGVENMHGAIIKLPAYHPLADPIVRHHQVNGEIFNVEFCVILQRLAVKRVQNRVPCSVGSGTGALHRRAFAKFRCVATKGTLVNFARLSARERYAVMLQLINRLRRLTSEVFHGICVAQPIRAFDRIIHMPLPAVWAHIPKTCRNTALGGHRMGTGRENFGDACRAQPLFGHAECGAQASAPGPNHHNIKIVGFIFISSHRYGLRNLKGEARDGKNSRGDGRVGHTGHDNDPDLAGQAMHIVLNHDGHTVFEM